MMKKLLSLILTLGLSFSVFAQSEALFNSITDSAFKAFEQTGAVYGFLKDGEVKYLKAMGYRNVQKNLKMEENTVFQVASISKAFTAASVGILVDRGLLNWNDKVVDHLPSFKLNDAYVSGNFLVKDLLCHRNGYNTFDGDLLWYETDYSPEEILKRFAKLEPKHGFREEYGYSNIMFIAAALLVEEKSGKSWEEFVKENIMIPLGMNDSYTDYEDFVNHNNIASPHIEKQADRFRNYHNAKGAVGVKSTVPDLLKWANMWLNYGVVNGDTILKPNTANYILNAHTAMQSSIANKKSGKNFKAAGLGWFIEEYAGITTFRHSGGLPGLILNLCMVPSENAAIAVLTNDESYLPFAYTNEMLDAIANTDVMDHIKVYAPYSKKGQIKNRIELPKQRFKKPWLKNDQIIGDYRDDYYGDAKIYSWKGGLKVHLTATKSFKSDLVWLGGLNYRIRFEDDPFLPDGTLILRMNADNEVEGFDIDLPNPDFHFMNLSFTKK